MKIQQLLVFCFFFLLKLSFPFYSFLSTVVCHFIRSWWSLLFCFWAMSPCPITLLASPGLADLWLDDKLYGYMMGLPRANLSEPSRPGDPSQSFNSPSETGWFSMHAFSFGRDLQPMDDQRELSQN